MPNHFKGGNFRKICCQSTWCLATCEFTNQADSWVVSMLCTGEWGQVSHSLKVLWASPSEFISMACANSGCWLLIADKLLEIVHGYPGTSKHISQDSGISIKRCYGMGCWHQKPRLFWQPSKSLSMGISEGKPLVSQRPLKSTETGIRIPGESVCLETERSRESLCSSIEQIFIVLTDRTVIDIRNIKWN